MEFAAAQRAATGDRAARRTALGRIATEPLDEWTALLVAGGAALAEGRAADAIASFFAQLSLALRIGDAGLRARSFLGLGRAYIATSDVGRGLLYLRIAQRDPDLAHDADLLAAFAQAYHALGLDADALAPAQQAAQASEGDLQATTAYAQLGQVQRALGLRDAARDSFDTACMHCVMMGDIAQLLTMQINLALLHVDAGNDTAAAEALERVLASAREERNVRLLAVVETNLGSVYRKLGNPAAQEHLLGGAGLAFNQHDTATLRTALIELAEITAASGNTHDAIGQIEQVIELSTRSFDALSDREGLAAAASDDAPYQLLQRVLLAADEPERALEAAERAKARVLARTLERHRGRGSTARDMKSVLSGAAFDVMTSAKLDAASRAALSAANLAHGMNVLGVPSSERIDLVPLTVAQMQTLAAQLHATMLVYAYVATDLPVVWVVASDSVFFRELPAASGGAGTALCTELITALSDGGAGATIPQLLRRAYDALIAPVADLLPAANEARLTIIPSGPLFRLPFAALTDAAGHPLIERFALFAAPAVRMLHLLHERTAIPGVVRGNAFIMANPVMPETFDWAGTAFDLDPLLGAEAEADAIGKLLDVKPVTGPDATRATVLRGLGSAGVVHLATHGLLSDASGTESAIVVTADDRNDPATGLLTADRLAACDISAGLVVLSACSTGVGRITGDGAAGFYRALHVAGAASVVASLWPISDDATMIFMQSFYREALRTNDYAVALQKATLATRRQYPDAIDWAAFLLSGLPAPTLSV